MVAALVAGVLVLAVGAGLALALTGGDDDDQSVQTEEASDSDDAGDQAEPGSDAGPTISECSVNPTNTCITDARVEGDTYVIEYESGFVESPDYEVGMHQHFFFDPPTVPDAAGSNASDFGLEEGDWEVYSGGSPFTLFTVSAGEAVGAERLCVRSANAPGHDFVPDSGNCVDLASIG
ncbi:MAG TPA: hypothetical protein VD926_11850 [Acidimicrobiales bacterium]|nr:hypothetical protein [Acidimicrobiales bacterium]